MGNKTPNIGLHLTSSNESEKKIADWIDEMSGTDPDSNMQLIDAAIQNAAGDIIDLQSSKANKSDVSAALGGKADLVSGKVPLSQLPAMDYDAAGSAAAVQGALEAKLNAHEGDGVKHWSTMDRSEFITMREAVFANVTSNPFSITFPDLSGVVVNKGNWNQAAAQLEW